jgi:hypothetical protein
MEDYLKIGLIQTTLDPNIAWDERKGTSINISSDEESRTWAEIKRGIYSFRSDSVENQPQIILLPELSVPLSKEKEVASISKQIGAIIIAGLDFCELPNNEITNKAVVFVPQNWPKKSRSPKVNKFYFGKTFFSNLEEDFFEKRGKREYPFPYLYLLDAGNYGRIGIAICSDFFDIERFVIYKGQIHHMFVISFNKDIKSYYFLAEAISRLVYCNVVICNSGYYGGSLGFSPFENEYKRNIYKHEGGKLFTSQIINLPVKELDKAQDPKFRSKTFKAKPPGYVKHNNTSHWTRQ